MHWYEVRNDGKATQMMSLMTQSQAQTHGENKLLNHFIDYFMHGTQTPTQIQVIPTGFAHIRRVNFCTCLS